ncbi:hypothetical protein BC938DRAFT_476631 [Jimgerdemannia flammicorona]|uniref:Uncharacterized protein n=1 Tax=Jimgerdemannia flammicorona TaxID=994334 RepID=A0A433PFF1_9FUNG|nr:hypothetical protein BC938DRAFT_476631 [Jimgerdemannia flammicorona]
MPALHRPYVTHVAADYDAIALSPIQDAPPDFDQTRFDATDENALAGALQLAEKLKQVSAPTMHNMGF